MAFEDNIADLKRVVANLERQGVQVKALDDAINSLESQVTNVKAIEAEIEAVRKEIIAPVAAELQHGHRLSKLSYYVGIIGLGLGLVGAIYPMLFQPEIVVNPTLSASPSDNPPDEATLAGALSRIEQGMRNVEARVDPENYFELKDGQTVLLPYEDNAIKTEGGGTVSFRFSHLRY